MSLVKNGLIMLALVNRNISNLRRTLRTDRSCLTATAILFVCEEAPHLQAISVYIFQKHS